MHFIRAASRDEKQDRYFDSVELLEDRLQAFIKIHNPALLVTDPEFAVRMAKTTFKQQDKFEKMLVHKYGTGLFALDKELTLKEGSSGAPKVKNPLSMQKFTNPMHEMDEYEAEEFTNPLDKDQSDDKDEEDQRFNEI